MRKLKTTVTVLAIALLLGSCTTLSTGILASPPGVNHYSFRECLLDDGFFTPSALAGIAKQDYQQRHMGDASFTPTRAAYLEMSNLGFIRVTATRFFDGLLSHQQFGDDLQGGPGDTNRSLLDTQGDRPYGVNIAGERPYPAAGFPNAEPPASDSDANLPENQMNRYLDCYIAPVGPENVDSHPGLLNPNEGDYDIEGRLLRAHILLAMLAQYGTNLVISHSSPKQPAYAAMLLKDITNAEMELRLASPVMNTDVLAKYQIIPKPEIAQTDDHGKTITTTTAISYLTDDFGGAQQTLRWDEQVTRILRVFQVAQDDELIDAKQSLDRLTNIIAAFSKPTLGAFKGLLTDSLKGLGSMQKVALYGDALLRDGRETLAVHRRRVMRMDAANQVVTGAGPFASLAIKGDPAIAAAKRGWTLWDGQIRDACTVLTAIAKDQSSNCIPSPAALQAEFEKRVQAAQGSEPAG